MEGGQCLAPQFERPEGHGFVLGRTGRRRCETGTRRPQRSRLGDDARPSSVSRSGDPPPVAVLLLAVDQASGHQAVDDGGDGRRAHGQSVGQARGGGRSLGQNPHDPVLGQGQIHLGQGHLDSLGQPGGDPAVGADARVVTDWTRRCHGSGGGADTSTIIQLDALTTIRASPIPGRAGAERGRSAALLRLRRWRPPPFRGHGGSAGSLGSTRGATARSPSRATRRPAGCRGHGGIPPGRRRSDRWESRPARPGSPTPAGSGGSWAATAETAACCSPAGRSERGLQCACDRRAQGLQDGLTAPAGELDGVVSGHDGMLRAKCVALDPPNVVRLGTGRYSSPHCGVPSQHRHFEQHPGLTGRQPEAAAMAEQIASPDPTVGQHRAIPPTRRRS